MVMVLTNEKGIESNEMIGMICNLYLYIYEWKGIESIRYLE